MAEGYGRQGIAVGGKGGRGLSSHYEFGVKNAREYLGEQYQGGKALGAAYDSAAKTLRSDLPGGVTVGNVDMLRAKQGARGKIKKLRDVAQAHAVSDFLGFAQGKGRGSMARASRGLISGEQYRPDDTTGFESAANQNFFGSGAGGVPSNYGKALQGVTGGANAWTMRDAILSNARPEKFGGTGPVDFREAALGATGHLHRQFAEEDKYVKTRRRVEEANRPAPEMGGDRLDMTKTPTKDSGPLGHRSKGMFAQAAASRVSAPQYGPGPRAARNPAYRRRMQDQYTAAVEKQRQSILNMTPGERYLHGISG